MTLTKPRRQGLGLVLLASLVTACHGLDSGAREQFGKTYSCPDGQIGVRARKDLNPADLFVRPTTAAPPEEVRSDPPRLAKWKADEAESLRARRAAYGDDKVFQVTGCGHDVLMSCKHPVDDVGGSTGMRMDLVTCVDAPRP